MLNHNQQTGKDTQVSQLNELSFQELDQTLKNLEQSLFAKNLFRQFAVECGNIYHQLSDPACKVLALLGVLNGLRREKNPDEAHLDQMIKHLITLVDKLPEGPEKDRCDGFLDYQAGVWNRAMGNFKAARDMQLCAAKKLRTTGRHDEAVVSEFMAAVESVNLYLSKQSPREISQTLQLLQERYARLQEQLAHTDDAMMLAHRDGNGPIHMIMAHYWAGETCPRYQHLFLKLQECLQNEHGEKFQPSYPTIESIVALWENNLEKAKELAVEVCSESTTDEESKATALLVLSEAGSSDPGYRQDILRNRIPMLRKGAPHINAVAQTRLQMMEKKYGKMD